MATGLTYKAVSSKHWASTIYIIVAVAVAVAGAFTVAGTVAIVWFIDWSYRLAQRKSYTHWFWLGFISLYFLIALAAIDWFAGILAPTQAINSQLLLFFYVLLPIVNAIWDWLSLGVTRSLLYAIVDKVHSGWRAFLWALMDGVLALIFLFFITLTTTATIALMNRISILGGGSAIVDLAWVFDSLRFEARDPDHWWLYFMFFSTLIPTVAHMVIASLSVLLWIPRHTLEEWTSNWTDEQHKFDLPKFLLAWGYLSFIAPLALIMPLFLTYGVFSVLFQLGGANTLGTGLLDFMQQVACWINP